MNVSSVMHVGLEGMQKSQAEILKSADQIVRSGTIDRDSDANLDLAEPMVNMKVEQHLFDASAKIVKTADEMLGTLMDIKA